MLIKSDFLPLPLPALDVPASLCWPLALLGCHQMSPIFLSLRAWLKCCCFWEVFPYQEGASPLNTSWYFWCLCYGLPLSPLYVRMTCLFLRLSPRAGSSFTFVFPWFLVSGTRPVMSTQWAFVELMSMEDFLKWKNRSLIFLLVF